MKKNRTVPILFLICLLLSGWGLFVDKAEANNLSVSNVSLSDTPGSGTATVQFTVSWDNSWRTSSAPNNYDAAWVFIKYSTDSGTSWTHATLKTGGTNPSGFSGGTVTLGGESKNSLDIVVPSDKKGGFVQINSADTGSGTLSATNIQFQWDYTTDGVGSSLPSSGVRVKVFGIEMVYVPTGNFYLGSTTGSTDVFRFYTYNNTALSWTVTSENAINLGTTSNYLWYETDPTKTIDGDETAATIWTAFPKGYNAFYVMKYEISQGQYADFLNILTSTQASARYPNKSGSYRHAISGSYQNYTTVVSSVDKKDRACNFLSWEDITAYADWAGLRPMTELEFEKAARGPTAVAANEYAWGGTTWTVATTISDTENGTETVTGSGGSVANCNWTNATTFTGGDGGTGPLRCGIFAISNSVRWTAGAGYYGAMELSGNVWELVVTVGNTKGRGFTGLHGDGALTSGGDADVTNWPTNTGTGSTTLADAAYGFRGGNWALEELLARVSSRLITTMQATYRHERFGGRLVRTAP